MRRRFAAWSGPSMLRALGTLGVLVVLTMALMTAVGCRPKYPKCEGDKDCHEHEYCVSGMCQQCRGDNDCNGGVCNQGRCESKPVSHSGCNDDTQCPPNMSCIDGACRACKADDECGPNGKCNAGRCDRSGANMQAERSDVGGCKFDPVYFDFNENVLSTEATAAIDHNADCLKKAAPGALTLTGHTDPRGTEEYNLALSDKRAQAVRDRLTRIGAAVTVVHLVPKGELEATGTDESGWAKDRRVDFTR